MFKTVAETVSYVGELRALVKDVRGVDIVIAPPFTAVAAAAEAVEGQRDRRGGAEHALGARGRVHR